MAQLAHFLGMSIAFCTDLGASAHVHINYNQYHGVINADTYALVTGNLPPRITALAVEWVMLNNDLIKSNWELHRQGNTNLAEIRPLVA